MRENKKKVFLSLSIFIGLLATFMIVSNAQASPSSQTIVTKLTGQADANPAINWYQIDNGSFRAEYTNDSEGSTYKDTPNAGTHSNPVPRNELIRDRINLRNYTSPQYEDSSGNKYSRSQVMNEEVVNVSFVSSPSFSGRNWWRSPSDPLTIELVTETGHSYQYSQRKQIEGETIHGYPKHLVTYNTPLDVNFRAERRETKEIRVVENKSLSVGEKFNLRAEVRTKFNEGNWSNWINVGSRLNETTWTSSNPSVATVSNTGQVTALKPGTTTITARWQQGDWDIQASAVIGVDEPVDPSPDPGGGDDGGGSGHIEAIIVGPTEVESGQSYKLDGSQSSSSGTIVEWKWSEIHQGQKRNLPAWEYSGTDSPELHRYDNRSTGGQVTYLLEIRDSNGRTASATHTVKIKDEVKDFVRANLQFELESFPSKITITGEQYEKDEEIRISGFVTARSSEVTSARGLVWFFGDVTMDDIEGLEPKNNERNLSHPKFQRFEEVNRVSSGYTLDPEKSTVSLQFKFRPSDPYIRAGIVLKHGSLDIYDYAVIEMPINLDLPEEYKNDFDLEIRPAEQWVYKGEDGVGYVVYKRLKSNGGLIPLNGQKDGVTLELSNPNLVTMEEYELIDPIGAYTNYYFEGIEKGTTTITATLGNKTATAILHVLERGEYPPGEEPDPGDFELSLDIEPKDAELYVNDNYSPRVYLESTNPNQNRRRIASDDPNLKLTFSPSNAVEMIRPDLYRGILDRKVTVKAEYDGPLSNGELLTATTTVTFKPYKPTAVITFQNGNEVYEYLPLQVSGGQSRSPNGEIVDYEWSISGTNQTIEGVKGTLIFENEGSYTITLTVTDNLGYKDTTTAIARVIPNKPTAHFVPSGYFKENRRVILDAGTSQGSFTGTIGVNHNLTEWQILPMDNQSPSSINILQGGNKQVVQAMFNEKGRYNVRVRVTNEKGVKSDWYEDSITIEPDIPPVAQFEEGKFSNYRDPENDNKATIVLEDYSYSKDSDIIGERRWYYRFNPNKDGDFENMSWIEIEDSRDKEIVNLVVDEVGQYEVKLVIRESFGQPTISNFYKDSMRKQDEVTKTVVVDNKSPEVSFKDIGLRHKTQVVILTDPDYPLTNDQIQQHFNHYLNEENIEAEIMRIDQSRFKYVEAQRSSSYDDGAYRGILEQYLYSGSYNPPHSKTVSVEVTYVRPSVETDYMSWVLSLPTTYNYNSDGYSGVLSNQQVVGGEYYPPPNDAHVRSITKRFSGTVTRPAIDTRVYRYRGQVEKNIFNRLFDEIDWDMNIDRYVIYLSNQNHPDFKKGSADFNKVVNELSHNGVHFYGIGREINEETLQNVLDAGLSGEIFITSSTSEVNQSLQEIANDIISRVQKEPSTTVTILVDEEFYPKTEYIDEENDPIFEERRRFYHTPNHFENPMGLHEKHGVWLEGDFPSSFDKVGKYVLNYQAKDDPVPGKDEASGFDVYRKWSNLASNAIIYVHRKPVADFSAHFIRPGNGNNEFLIIDRSYDLDAYSQGDRGIKTKKWRFRRLDGSDNTWKYKSNYVKPTLSDFNISGEYEIELTVEDFQGAFDTHREIVTILLEPPNMPPEAGFIHETPPYVVGERVSLISTAIDPNGDTLTISYKISKPNGEIIEIPEDQHKPKMVGGKPVYYQKNHPDNFIRKFIVDEVGQYRITQTVSDGEYSDIATATIEVKDLTITGMVKHVENWTELHKQRTCEDGPCPEYEFYSGERIILEAVIDDYPVLDVDGVEQVLVRIKGERQDGSTVSIGYGVSNGESTRSDPIMLRRIPGTTTYEGEWYEEWMTEPSKRFKQGEIVEFEFEVIYQRIQDDGHINRQVRIDPDNILIIGTVYDAFPQHRNY